MTIDLQESEDGAKCEGRTLDQPQGSPRPRMLRRPCAGSVGADLSSARFGTGPKAIAHNAQEIARQCWCGSLFTGDAGRSDKGDHHSGGDIGADRSRFLRYFEEFTHSCLEVALRWGSRLFDFDASTEQGLNQVSLQRALLDQMSEKGKEGYAWIIGVNACPGVRRDIDETCDEDRFEKFLFGGKVPIEGAHPDSRPLSDQIHGDRNPLGGEDGFCRLKHPGSITQRIRARAGALLLQGRFQASHRRPTSLPRKSLSPRLTNGA